MVNREKLHKALSLASVFISHGNNINFKTDHIAMMSDKAVFLYALNVGIDAAFNLKKIQQYTKLSPDEKIHFTLEDKPDDDYTLTVSGNKYAMRLKSEESKKFYQKTEGWKPITFNYNEFVAAFRHVYHCVGININTEAHVLNGVCFGLNPNTGFATCTLAATDGSKLAADTINIRMGAIHISKPQRFVISPHKLFLIFEKMDALGIKPETFTLYYSEDNNNVSFEFKTSNELFSVTLTKIFGTFPNYEPMFPNPDKTKNCFSINRHDLIMALLMVEPMVNRQNVVKFNVNENGITLESHDQGIGHAVSSIHNFTLYRKDMQSKFSINYEFLKTALDTFQGDTVKIHHNDGYSPLLFTCQDNPYYRLLIMPISSKD